VHDRPGGDPLGKVLGVGDLGAVQQGCRGGASADERGVVAVVQLGAVHDLETPGLVGYTLNAGLARKTFLTFSVWEDQASLDRFAVADPHRNIIARLRPRMQPTKFEFFPISGADLPPTWEQITARLS
jgi:hypothetical protein